MLTKKKVCPGSLQDLNYATEVGQSLFLDLVPHDFSIKIIL